MNPLSLLDTTPSGRRRWGVVVVISWLALSALPAVGSAQLPGYKGRTPEQLRAQFLQGLMEGVNDVWDEYESRWMDDEDLGDLFSNDALMFVPGEEGRRGKSTIQDYLGLLLPEASGIDLATAHVDGSDDLAVVFGPYRVTGVAGPEGIFRDDGDHITVLRQEGRFWRIRLQVFISAPSGQPQFWWHGEPAEWLPVFHLGLPIGSSEFRNRVRRGAYGRVGGTLTEFRTAWAEGDAERIRELVTEDVFLRTPGGQIFLGADGAVGGIQSEPMGFGSVLQSAPLDFEASGRIAVASSRFALEDEAVPEDRRTGTLFTVLRVVGREWKVRALFFAPPG